jgi:YD repeat-containing protein
MNYDFKGNPLMINENLLSDYTIIDVDWSSSPTLNTETFATLTTYDALSRPVTVTDAGNNVTQHTYDIGGLLFAVTVTPNSGSPTAYINDIYYNAKDQRETIDYGNGTTTTYAYDINTFRLTRLLTQMGSNVYQDLNYWYDPVGNITILNDASQRNLYFNNSIVLPEVNYTYDTLYRLIIATGRETPPPSDTDIQARSGTKKADSTTWVLDIMHPGLQDGWLSTLLTMNGIII